MNVKFKTKTRIRSPRNQKDYPTGIGILPEFCLNELKVIRSALVFFHFHVSEEAPHLIRDLEQTLAKVNGLLQDNSN